MSSNIRRNRDTSSNNMVTTVTRFRDSGGKSSSLKEKEMVRGRDCLESSLYNMLRFLHEKFICLFCAANVDTIDFASLPFPCSTKCREFL